MRLERSGAERRAGGENMCPLVRYSGMLADVRGMDGGARTEEEIATDSAGRGCGGRSKMMRFMSMILFNQEVSMSLSQNSRSS